MSIVQGVFTKITSYLSGLFQNIHNLDKSLFIYAKYDKPLYRGLPCTPETLKQYEVNKVHYWPAFSSTSKKKDVAIQFAQNNKVLLFEIFITINDRLSHINLPRSWSFYPGEEEVLLLPSFCF